MSKRGPWSDSESDGPPVDEGCWLLTAQEALATAPTESNPWDGVLVPVADAAAAAKATPVVDLTEVLLNVAAGGSSESAAAQLKVAKPKTLCCSAGDCSSRVQRGGVLRMLYQGLSAQQRQDLVPTGHCHHFSQLCLQLCALKDKTDRYIACTRMQLHRYMDRILEFAGH